MCLDHTLFKNQVECECLQILVERYYQRKDISIMWTCPNLVSLLAQARCVDCPWDRLNSTRMETYDIKRDDAYWLFHRPGDECSIASHVEIFKLNFNTGTFTHARLIFSPAF